MKTMKQDVVIVAGVKGSLPGWLNGVVSQWVHDGDARSVSPLEHFWLNLLVGGGFVGGFFLNLYNLLQSFTFTR